MHLARAGKPDDLLRLLRQYCASRAGRGDVLSYVDQRASGRRLVKMLAVRRGRAGGARRLIFEPRGAR